MEPNLIFELLQKEITHGFLSEKKVVEAIFFDMTGHEPSATVQLTMSELKGKVFARLADGTYTVEKLSLCANVLIASTYPKGAPTLVDISTSSS
jgi:hypothetical protein